MFPWMSGDSNYTGFTEFSKGLNYSFVSLKVFRDSSTQGGALQAD